MPEGVLIQSSSFNGPLDLVNGYSSCNIDLRIPQQFHVNYECGNNTTITIYGMSTKLGRPTATKKFQEFVPAYSHFYRRFPITSNWAYFTITTTDSEVVGLLILQSKYDKNLQYESATNLNSKVIDNANCQLIRVANNFQNDLVRNLHSQFEKVNIQGIYTNTIYGGYPSVEETVGNDQNFTNYSNSVATPIYETSSSVDDDTNGIGAQAYRLKYIDADGDVAFADFYTGNGWLGISARSIISMTVFQVGSSGKNLGKIRLHDLADTHTYCTMYPNQNLSHMALYQVPTNKELVVRNLSLTGSMPQGEVTLIVTDTNGIEGVFGRFLIDTTQEQLNFDLDTLLSAGQMLRVNYIPSGTTTTQPALITVNINCMLSNIQNDY